MLISRKFNNIKTYYLFIYLYVKIWYNKFNKWKSLCLGGAGN